MNVAAVDISIIIVSWNTRDLLAQCLQSVYDTVGNLAFEVIVVDNASADGSPTMVYDQFPQVRLIENLENEGFARANNQAIDICTGRYVLLLNSDTVVLPDAIERMVTFADTHPQIGALGAELCNGDGSLQPSWAQFPSLVSEWSGRNFRGRQPYMDGKAYIVDWVGGSCLLVRRQVIEQIGLLDENIFMYSEETDWCYRIVQAGWQIGYLPGAKVIHFGGASSRKQSESRTLIQLYKSKLYFFRKHYGASQMELLRIGIMILTLLKMVILYPQTVFNAERKSSDFNRQWMLFRALRGMGLKDLG
jgi:GT2 family glycosyltransferase